MLMGYALKRFFKMPAWIVPAISFNNTTSLPLLLIQSLATTGILESLLMSESYTPSAAVERAKSYFLVNSVVSNVLTFALGPKLLDEGDPHDDAEPTENGHYDPDERNDTGQGQANGDQQNENDDELTSLLPNPIVRAGNRASRTLHSKGSKKWEKLPDWARTGLEFAYGFVNPPMCGAIIGAVIGLAPPLHRAFFNDSQEGGIFNAWLTASIKNIGELFAAMQVVVVGVKLSSSLRKWKRGEDSGDVPWLPTTCVLLIRFVFWPVYVYPIAAVSGS